jgi:hypothetical protein
MVTEGLKNLARIAFQPAKIAARECAYPGVVCATITKVIMNFKDSRAAPAAVQLSFTLTPMAHHATESVARTGTLPRKHHPNIARAL